MIINAFTQSQHLHQSIRECVFSVYTGLQAKQHWVSDKFGHFKPFPGGVEGVKLG